jgi:hypothetical protein
MNPLRRSSGYSHFIRQCQQSHCGSRVKDHVLSFTVRYVSSYSVATNLPLFWSDQRAVQQQPHTKRHRLLSTVNSDNNTFQIPKLSIPSTTPYDILEPTSNLLNSSLTIEFEDSFMETLHGIICDFRKTFEEALRPQEYRKPSTVAFDRPVLPLYINVRPLESLSSITLFDGYDTICALSPDRLSKYHLKLTRRFKKCGFLCEGDSSAMGGETYHWWIRLREFRVVPNDKLDRIIAIFHPSPFWKHLHKQVQGLAARTPGLYRTMSVEECEQWLPSVTVADVENGMGGCTKDERLLRELLSVLPFDKVDVSSTKQNISIGGTVPTQVPLDWNFLFQGSPLLEIREGTSLQDMFPDPAYDPFTYDRIDYMEEESDSDDIEDSQVIADPLENYMVSLENVELEPTEDTMNFEEDSDVEETLSDEMNDIPDENE